MAIAVTPPEHVRKKYKKEPVDNSKQKGWATPHGFIDMTHPCTYEEACAEMEKLYNQFAHKFEE